MFDFNEIIERRGTGSVKYDFNARKGKPEDVIPLWIADMDFQSPPAVLKALSQRIDHGVFGYSDAADESYFIALQHWYQARFGWEPKSEWLVKSPGVVFAICMAIRALTKEEDACLIQQPVYHPFEYSIRSNGRRVVVNPLVYRNGRYHMNFDLFERQIVEEKVKIFILCSPHNPVGRVWTKEELTTVGDICVRHGVLVISDEIHADFIYPGYRHLVFAGLKPEYADIAITCTAPTKTFNLAGLQISNIFIKDSKIRRLFYEEMLKTGYSQPNLMGLLACKAAYEDGDKWLDELMSYITGNLTLLRDFLRNELPAISLVEPEGTYLTWLDCSKLGLTDRELDDLFLHRARIWLNAGSMFGVGGEGFQRMNIACPRALLKQALDRMKEGIIQ